MVGCGKLKSIDGGGLFSDLCNGSLVFFEKGGWGVFTGIPSYVIDGVGVSWWLPGVFCALLCTFCDVLARAGLEAISRML